MQKDFITVTPDSGTGDATVTVKTDKTEIAKERTSTISVSGGGITRAINVKQAGGTFGADTKIEFNLLEFPVAKEINRISDVGKKVKEVPIQVYFEGSFNGTKIEKKDVTTDSNLSVELSEFGNMKGEAYEEFLRCFEVKKVENKLELWYKKQASSSIFPIGRWIDPYAFFIYSIYGGQFKYGNDGNEYPQQIGLLVEFSN